MHTRLLLLFTLLSFQPLAQVAKKPIPTWVDKIDFKDQVDYTGEGSYKYLLVDFQDNLIEESAFRHYAIKIINSEGVQSMSDLDTSYDPSFQKLSFHSIRVFRDGTMIDKLAESEINLIQRETQMNRALYDGSVTAIVNLKDVREGDIIEYSFSRKGFNPIKKGHFATNYSFEYSIPINHIYNRLVTNQPIYYKLLKEAPEPIIRHDSHQTEYIWNIHDVNEVTYDNNVPAWYNEEKMVLLSTSQEWSDITSWAADLYHYDHQKIKTIPTQLEGLDTKEERILQIIRLVQDEVRYLGFESGIGAYQANPPSKVFEQRYGDCKDKSLLLVALLREEGVAAYPMLVNTVLKQSLKDRIPSPNAFDHCVVNFQFEDKDYFIDPTMSNQGGELDKIYFPAYKWGLIVKKGINQLIEIPEGEKTLVQIDEEITVNEVGGSANSLLRTTYTGRQADYIRSYFSSNSIESIGKEYQDYYSALYPDVELLSKVRLIDESRKEGNRVIVEEEYLIKEFWQKVKEGVKIYGEIYPLYMENEVTYKKSSSRTMPYYLGQKRKIAQNTKVIMPESWNVTTLNKTISGHGFFYQSQTKKLNNKEFVVSYEYETSLDYIPGDSVNRFLELHNDIKNDLSFNITYDENLEGFQLSWTSILVAIVTLIIGAFLAYKLHERYDPVPFEFADHRNIGGWLIFPSITMLINPLVTIYNIIATGFFNQVTWSSSIESFPDMKTELLLFIGGELVYNVLFLVFSILLLIQFFLKRTSLPLLISIYYCANFIFPAVDVFLSELLFPQQEMYSESTGNIGRGFIAAAIWVPYFNLSKRVKNTFSRKKEQLF